MVVPRVILGITVVLEVIATSLVVIVACKNGTIELVVINVIGCMIWELVVITVSLIGIVAIKDDTIELVVINVIGCTI